MRLAGLAGACRRSEYLGVDVVGQLMPDPLDIAGLDCRQQGAVPYGHVA